MLSSLWQFSPCSPTNCAWEHVWRLLQGGSTTHVSFAIEKAPSLWGEHPLWQNHGCRKGTREQREKENSHLLGQIQPIKLDVLGRNMWRSSALTTLSLSSHHSIIIFLGKDQGTRIFPLEGCLDSEAGVCWSTQARNGQINKQNPRALTAVDLVRLVQAVLVAVAHPLHRDAAPISTAVLLRGAAVWRRESPSDAGNQRDGHLARSGSWFQLRSIYSNCPNTSSNVPVLGLAQCTSHPSLWAPRHCHYDPSICFSDETLSSFLRTHSYFCCCLLFCHCFLSLWETCDFMLAPINRTVIWISPGRELVGHICDGFVVFSDTRSLRNSSITLLSLSQHSSQ